MSGLGPLGAMLGPAFELASAIFGGGDSAAKEKKPDAGDLT
jgi:hypothetical protein